MARRPATTTLAGVAIRTPFWVLTGALAVIFLYPLVWTAVSSVAPRAGTSQVDGWGLGNYVALASTGDRNALAVTPWQALGTSLGFAAAATGIAGHPPETGGEFSALQPFDVADGAQRRHHHVDVERGAVGELGAPDVSVGVSFEGLDCDTGTQVDSGVTLHLGGDIADHPAKRADQRGTGSLCDCHVQSEVTTNGGHF